MEQMTDKISGKQKNYGLDVARACAVALVFLSHSILNLYTEKVPFLWYGVFIGVELFFSLSGFLIGRMLLELFNQFHNKLSFKHIANFWVRRWLRTLPLYFILYAIYLFTYNQWLYPVTFNWKYLFFLQNIATPPPGFYGESWSLGIEEWFYLLFPVLLFGVYLLKRSFTASGKINKVFIPVVLVIIITQIIIRAFNPACNAWGCIAVSLHFDAAAYGLIAAYISKHIKQLNPRSAVYVIIAGLIVCLAAAAIKIKTPGTSHLAQLYFPVNGVGTALLIIGLYYCKFPVKFIAIPFLSRISYSIYLLHLSGIIIPLKAITKNTTLEGTWLLWLISLVLTIPLAALSYVLFEKPFLKIRDKWFPAYSKV